MSITRRVFLRNGALALVGTSALPAFLSRAVMASETTPGSFKNKRLVVIFQRGAADGLNVVVPFSEKRYYELRPSIGVAAPSSQNSAQNGGQNSASDLDGHFALHPSLQPLKPLWEKGHLAIVEATGSPEFQKR